MSAALWSLDAERGLIGALMHDNALIELMGELRTQHFHDPLHRKLYEDVTGMIAAGRLADPVSMRNRYHGTLSEIGGASYLLNLIAERPRLSKHVREYAALVRDLADRRTLKAVADGILSDLSAGTDALTTLALADDGLKAVDAGAGPEPVDMADALAMGFDAPPGLATGYACLDHRLGGLHPGDLILLAARPSMGKSALARNIAVALAWRGRKVHFASLEMTTAQLAARTASAMSFETNAPFEYAGIRRHDAGLDREMVMEHGRRIPRSIVIDERGAQTLPMLEASARATRRKLGGLDAIFVDYIQIMRALTSENRVQQVTELSGGLKALAKSLGVPVVALSQLSRANEAREDKRPTLADLRDSGSLEQDADAVIGVYREAYYLERAEPKPASFADEHAFETAWNAWCARLQRSETSLELITLKQRHGPVGTDEFEFFPAFDVIRERPRAVHLRVVS